VTQRRPEIELEPGRLTLTHLSRPLGGLVASYRVYIDGLRVARLGRGKAMTFDLRPGEHVLKIKIPYCDSGDFTFRVAPGRVVNLTCRARPYSRGSVLTERHNWVLIDRTEPVIA
jgi:hypothetical protein